MNLSRTILSMSRYVKIYFFDVHLIDLFIFNIQEIFEKSLDTTLNWLT